MAASSAKAGLLAPPANVFRLALHPDGLAARVRNLPEWGRHITENLRAQLGRSPDPSLDPLLVELEGYLPPLPPRDDVLGFAVPLEAFLPADDRTAEVLRRRWR